MLGSMTVVVPTRDGGREFQRLAGHLEFVRDRYDLEILIVDSGSIDETPSVARQSGFRLLEIPSEQFGHGRTRNLAVSEAEGELVAFLTQDVLPCTKDWPERLAIHFEDPLVAAAYGRQVPRNASTSEMFFVARNYPPHPVRYSGGADDTAPRPGRVLLSNAFSVVRRSVALEIPFVPDIPVSEDQVFAHQALRRGYDIVYEPTAEALHAHTYTLWELWDRVYYVGAALQAFGLDRGASIGEALRFARDLVVYHVRQGHVHRLPALVPYEAVRWLGFQAGRLSGRTPRSFD